MFRRVEAEILVSKVVVRTQRDSDGYTNTDYVPEFRYRYTVAGKTHESTQFAYFYEMSKERVYREVEARPVRSSTTAYYDPDQPSEAVLYRGVTSATAPLVIIYSFAAVGFGLALAGVIVLARRKLRR